jgi:aspartyl-tRNA(Asn)/glutamyl-tRNA(Gln) amidotransferase subunit B
MSSKTDKAEEIVRDDDWELDYSETGDVIGLEMHVQLNQLKTKLFCSCDSQYRSDTPNSHCCPVCLGLPGSLPVINNGAVDAASKLALAVGSKISPRQFFHRKNYYYPDMSRNFQISQYNRGGGVPFADGGEVIIKTKDGKRKTIHLDRMHLEDDPGKLVHQGSLSTSPYTLVDYNRCGTTLIEIVTKPEMHSPEEARAFCNKIRAIISHIDISDITLDGAFRVDANVSRQNTNRVEIKNIGSVRDVEKALKWEIFRHKQEVKRGKTINQETRAWNGKQTVLLRTKEQEDDYRYFPEPDLVPFTVSDEKIKTTLDNLPELPDVRIKRFISEYDLLEYDADVLISDKRAADFFEECAKEIKEYKLLLNWINNDIQGYLNDDNKSIADTKLKPNLLIELMQLVKKGTISIKMAKKMVPDILEGKSPNKVVKSKGLSKITDKSVLGPIGDQVIKDNPNIVADIKKKPKAFMGLVGKVMQATKGKADTIITQELLAEKIKFDLKLLRK